MKRHDRWWTYPLAFLALLWDGWFLIAVFWKEWRMWRERRREA